MTYQGADDENWLEHFRSLKTLVDSIRRRADAST